MYRLFRYRAAKRGNITNCEETDLRDNSLRLLNHVRVDPDILNMCTANPIEIPPEDKFSHVRNYVVSHLSPEPQWSPLSYVYLLLLGSFWGLCNLFWPSIFDAMIGRSIYVFQGTFGLSAYLASFLLLNSVLWQVVFKLANKSKLYQYWYGVIKVHSYSLPISPGPGVVSFKREWAKVRKHGRLYVSYASSILNMGWFFSHLKTYFCTERIIPTHPHLPLRINLVKALDESVRPVWEPLPGLSVRIFSDDIELVWYNPATNSLFRYDVDISGCDAGNTSAMFYFLARESFACGATREMIAASYSRLTGPLMCRNPSNQREFVKVRPRTIYQGSGCPETTMVNNVASLSIILAVYKLIVDNVGQWEDGPESYRTGLITDGAALIGHQVSIDRRHRIQESQFLKYSPAQSDTGEWVFYRNLGAIFRSLGSCDGDVDPSKLNLTTKQFRKLTMEEKGERFMRAVVAGLCNEPTHPVMEALRERFPPSKVSIPPSYMASAHDRRHYRVGLQELMLRYGGTEEEWEELLQDIRDLRFGVEKESPMLSRIYAVDYGLE
jgi:hypothetical protein